ncbi:DUF3618 domain-containing protein [Herbiconiux moechotypicola]|uniref:DUF3618 domain-containing protein n=1 Tax=Herbiconiux moechotypicola TaxID=637393 RepID=A0ABN3DBF1_9MICO|nr:DUF3618 domain-containing protein [Herbiconiux moechotypicola]MCS5728849.1 DUF3618 domain-containing protein [Herbiconiux moechotypicola]
MSDTTGGSPASDTPAQRSKAELHADIEKTRGELRATLDAIEFRLNLPKQARHAAHRVKSRVKRFASQNPVGFSVVVAAGVAAVVGAGVLGFRYAGKK